MSAQIVSSMPLRPSSYQKDQWKKNGIRYEPGHPDWGHLDLVGGDMPNNDIGYYGYYYRLLCGLRHGFILINMTTSAIGYKYQDVNRHYHLRWIPAGAKGDQSKLIIQPDGGFEVAYYIGATPYFAGEYTDYFKGTQWFPNDSIWIKSFWRADKQSAKLWFENIYLNQLQMKMDPPTDNPDMPVFEKAFPLVNWTGFEDLVPIASQQYIESLFDPAQVWIGTNEVVIAKDETIIDTIIETVKETYADITETIEEKQAQAALPALALPLLLWLLYEDTK